MKLNRLFAWLLCMILLLTACGPATAVTNPSGGTAALPAAAEPAKAIVHDSFTISVPIRSTDDDRDNRHAFLQRLQGLLRGRGWKVNLIDMPYSSSGDQSDEDAILNIIQTQAASGKGSDAWLVYKTLAKRLQAKGLTQDMATVMPKASSMLWDLCKGAFAGGADGVPAMLTTKVVNQPIGLQISATQLQAYGTPIANVDDLLTFLEKRPDASILTADIYTLTGAWAAQQGYYSLADYGLPPFFYARTDDASCTPVPVEDIAGFDEFFLRWTALWQDGRLHGANDGYARKSGVLSILSGVDARVLQQAMGLQGADIVALPLDGCTRVLPEDPPICNRMFAVSAASQQAPAVAGFAQWALLDRQGYDLCTLGQRDTDYRLDGERVEYLNAGVPLSDADWKYDPKSTAFYRYRNMLVWYSGMVRVEKGGADNLEQVLDGIKIESPPPLSRVRALHGDLFDRMELFAAARNPYQDVLDQRMQGLTYSTNDGAPEPKADQALQRLRENRPKLDPLMLDLKKRLKQLLDDPDGDPTQTAAPAP